MKHLLLTMLKRFARSQSGSATIEFAITFPVLITLMLSGIELGFVSLQHAMLERAMDITVRDIRLGTGSVPQHADIIDLICERAGFISNCDTTLRLEMIQVDPRNWTDIDATPDCIDRSVEVSPVRNFVNGQENELVILRACAMIDPVFPTTGLGQSLSDGGTDGQFALVATSAFVQEPE